ncbi:uncharacterized protein PHALS_06717 [Plasmopara halstedii]|uniref:Uncharacterized protein n=1 Tax=Plasmopara halstedii TaxID=4781 RepID=A0A0P1B5H8_PLAHL|nr:uncharacterized protein PHALS_06717 [Plasmopara halstedii]CEG48925.1 hypothetical protein PHALS_06717 [Plasmopara halstedii]|eukprot:XP_024585294.1 hypothetical protein PHALS_06717 [Plasmopara halstedii]
MCFSLGTPTFGENHGRFRPALLFRVCPPPVTATSLSRSLSQFGSGRLVSERSCAQGVKYS